MCVATTQQDEGINSSTGAIRHEYIRNLRGRHPLLEAIARSWQTTLQNDTSVIAGQGQFTQRFEGREGSWYFP